MRACERTFSSGLRILKQKTSIKMQAFEFMAQIKDGTIEVPPQYHHLIGGQARVIVLTDDLSQPTLTERISIMNEAVEQLSDRRVFGGIEDPVAWQQSLRDEWE